MEIWRLFTGKHTLDNIILLSKPFALKSFTYEVINIQPLYTNNVRKYSYIFRHSLAFVQAELTYVKNYGITNLK